MVELESIAKNYLLNFKAAAELIDPRDIQEIAQLLLKVHKDKKQIFLLGNGGSASTCSHMAIDFGKGTLVNYYNKNEKRVKVISLTDNVPALTAIGNDLSFDDIFVEQLANFVEQGDVVIGLTGSGNSANIIKALIYAKSRGAVTVGFLGSHHGGRTKDFCDFSITIQSTHQGIIEDLHLSLGHILTDCLSFALKQESKNQSNGARIKKDFKGSS